MNTIDILLTKDSGRLELPTKEVELPRLTELFGEKVIFKLKGLSNEQFAYIRESSMDGDNVDRERLQALTVIEGTIEPDLKDSRLREKYNCTTNLETINNLLRISEIIELAECVSKLTGFGENSIKEIEKIKN